MRKAILTVVLFVIFSGTSMAQITPSIYIGGGLNIPMGPELFKDYMKTGNNFCGGVGIQINPMFEIGGTVAYNTIGPDFDKILGEFASQLPDSLQALITGIEIDGFEIHALEFLADAKIILGGEESPLKFYGLVCAGISRLSLSNGTINGQEIVPDSLIDTTETKFTYGLGAGINQQLSPSLSLFAEGRYMFIAIADDDVTSIEDINIDPASFGVTDDNLTHIALRAGIRFTFGGE